LLIWLYLPLLFRRRGQDIVVWGIDSFLCVIVPWFFLSFVDSKPGFLLCPQYWFIPGRFALPSRVFVGPPNFPWEIQFSASPFPPLKSGPLFFSIFRHCPIFCCLSLLDWFPTPLHIHLALLNTFSFCLLFIIVFLSFPSPLGQAMALCCLRLPFSYSPLSVLVPFIHACIFREISVLLIFRTVAMISKW